MKSPRGKPPPVSPGATIFNEGIDMSLHYLATPYSHPDVRVRRDRYRTAQYITSILALKGFVLYSPITFWHNVAEKHDMPKDAAYWWNVNKTFIDLASGFFAVEMDGWKESLGMKQEIDYAMSRGLKIQWLQVPTEWPTL